MQRGTVRLFEIASPKNVRAKHKLRSQETAACGPGQAPGALAPPPACTPAPIAPPRRTTRSPRPPSCAPAETCCPSPPLRLACPSGLRPWCRCAAPRPPTRAFSYDAPAPLAGATPTRPRLVTHPQPSVDSGVHDVQVVHPPSRPRFTRPSPRFAAARRRRVHDVQVQRTGLGH